MRHTKIIKEGKVDGPLIDVVIDFFTTYVDKIPPLERRGSLFRELQKENRFSVEHKQIMDDL